MVKRTGIVCLLFALLAGTLIAPAEAGKRKPKKITRDAVATYQLPGFGSASVGGFCTNPPNPCPSFPISTQERWVMVEVDDASATAVAFDITQVRRDGSCCDGVDGPFCESSGKKPVEITPGLDVRVLVHASGDVVCPGAFGTSGTVTVVFSNVP